MRVGFLVSKPLQFFLASSIARDGVNATDRFLYVVNGFHGACEFFERLMPHEFGFEQKFFFEEWGEAYRHFSKGGVDQVFIDSDVGVNKFLTLMCLRFSAPDLRIAVYEEGIGTYRDDLYSGLKRRLLSSCGVGVHFGGSSFVDEVWVTRPAAYVGQFGSKKPVKLFSISYEDFSISGLGELFSGKKFLVSRGSAECIFYMTGWTIDYGLLDDLEQRSGVDIFVKLHPHIKDNSLKLSNAKSLPPSLPAEFVISELAKAYDYVTVLHCGTSAEFYCQKYPNVEWVRLGCM